MSEKTLKPIIDPELKRQLAALAPDKPVQVTFTLRTPEGERFMSATQTRATVDRILSEAAGEARSKPERVQVFANVQSFAVEASRALVQLLLGSKEIASAMANSQEEEMLIRPVQRREKND